MIWQPGPEKASLISLDNFQHPIVSITSSVSVAELVHQRDSESISLFNAILYCIMTAANAVPELRLRFREDIVVEHDLVHASATVPIDDNRFAFCGIKYVPEWETFNASCVDALEKAKQQNELQEHIDNSDEWIFLSCLPWMNFTALTNPNGGPDDCIPRISWGKLDNQGSNWTIPVAVQVHHALVDGVHVGKFYQALAESISTGFKKRVRGGYKGCRVAVSRERRAPNSLQPKPLKG